MAVLRPRSTADGNPPVPASDHTSLRQLQAGEPGAAMAQGGDRGGKATCSVLHLPPQRLRSIRAVGIPADFNSNYKTINQHGQDFDGHKKRVREDVCLHSS